jgi:hypothetical protein
MKPNTPPATTRAANTYSHGEGGGGGGGGHGLGSHLIVVDVTIDEVVVIEPITEASIEHRVLPMIFRRGTVASPAARPISNVYRLSSSSSSGRDVFLSGSGI